MGDSQHDTRPSPIAGRWYPGAADDLAASVDAFLDRADVPALDGHLIGVLAPHAGHRYSGPVAGAAFKPVAALEVDVVALVGPSHYPYPGPIVATSHSAYQTPLGEVPVDRDALAQLQDMIPIQFVRRDQEHSLEIELPFLQRTLSAFTLIPLALIDQSESMARTLGHALAGILDGRKALVVASSDLSHFYPQAVANRLDQTVLDAVAAYDPQAVIQAEEVGKGFACGRGAIATIMIAARELGANTAQVVGYATSGDVTRDFNQVVGYGAAWFYRAN
jgi:AmmeMemoRadiSam system protein B